MYIKKKILARIFSVKPPLKCINENVEILLLHISLDFPVMVVTCVFLKLVHDKIRQNVNFLHPWSDLPLILWLYNIYFAHNLSIGTVKACVEG